MTPQLPTMTSQAFITKWRNVEFGEQQASQEMFLDLCALVGHPTPWPTTTQMLSPLKSGFPAGLRRLSGRPFRLGVQGQR